MKNKKRKTNQARQHLVLIVSFAIFCLIALLGVNVISQNNEQANDKIISEQSQREPQSSEDEARKLINTLKEKKESRETIIAAIQMLGNMSFEEAIPELIKYLDYEKIFVRKEQPKYVDGVEIDGTEVTRKIPLSGRYPTTAALFQIGESALPALVKVIEEEKTNSVRSQNALYTIQQIFRGNLLKGILYLEKAMTESKNINGSKRLQFAARKTRLC